MELWRSSKDGFRKKYYGNKQPDITTPYMAFGKEVAEMLESKEVETIDPTLKKIPKYDYPEYPLEVEIEGIPIKGFVDSFCTKKNRILEYKTGIRRKDGTPPWDPVRVKKHNQLLLYSLCTKELLGEVHPVTKLVWIETHWVEKCVTKQFGETEFEECGPYLELTGAFEKFNRKIEDWEHQWMRNEIVRIATEISEDYTRYVENSLGNNVN